MTTEVRKILVFAASSNGASPVYRQEAEKLGQLLGARGYGIIYGGGACGLMGAAASRAAANGSAVTGVMIEAFRTSAEEPPPQGMQELVVESLMHRKSHMLFEADAAVVLPGGIGTLDELWEVAAAQDLRFYQAPDERLQPIIVMNVNGFYDDTIRQIEKAEREGFLKPGRRALFEFVSTAEQAVAALDAHRREGRMTARAALARATGFSAPPP